MGFKMWKKEKIKTLEVIKVRKVKLGTMETKLDLQESKISLVWPEESDCPLKGRMLVVISLLINIKGQFLERKESNFKVKL